MLRVLSCQTGFCVTCMARLASVADSWRGIEAFGRSA